MTIQAMAVIAANTLRYRAAYENDLEHIASAERQQRIVARFGVVYVPDHSAYYAQKDTVRINGVHFHANDVATCEHCSEGCSERYDVRCRAQHSHNLVSEAWCSDCRGEDAFACADCGDFFASAEQGGLGETSYCQNCYDTVAERVPCYHAARRWTPPCASCYSVELELEAEERGNLVKLLEIKRLEKVSWEKDVSLSDAKGLEILIQLRANLALLSSDACEIVRAIKGKGLGLRSWDGENCGLHLNSSTHGWTVRHLMRLVWIVRSCKDALVSISGRESDQWASFAHNGYSLKDEADCKTKKYRALRIGPDRMEWRMFRGTLSEKRIRLYCDTVAALEALAQSDIPAHDLRATANSALVELAKRSQTAGKGP